jgi:hypothetical protein
LRSRRTAKSVTSDEIKSKIKLKMLPILEIMFGWEVSSFAGALLVGYGWWLGSDEVKRYRAARFALMLAGVWMIGGLVMWSFLSTQRFWVRVPVVFVAAGLIVVGLSETARLIGGTADVLPNDAGTVVAAQQQPTENNSNQQQSSGSNSPNNSITGSPGATIKNTYVINSKPPSPGFHEKIDAEKFDFSIGPITLEQHIDSLRKGPFTLFAIGNTPVATIRMKGEKLLFSIKPWSGDGKPVIELHDNEFTSRVPSNWDRNSNENALEVINGGGNPVFQIVRVSPTHYVMSGIFAQPGGSISLIGNGMLSNGPTPEQLNAFRLKPLFRYPSWKYPGVYAN